MKNYSNIQALSRKLLFTVSDVAEVFGIEHKSAWVLCSRYVKEGIFVRLKNNLYVMDVDWDHLSQSNLFKISNYLQVPSYISFLTALSFYGLSTQVQRNYFESAALKRTKRITIKNTFFSFYRMNEKLYSGFIKKEEFFIAVPEKAFADAVYLYSLGRYSLDFSSLDIKNFDKKILIRTIREFPLRTQLICKKICKI